MTMYFGRMRKVLDHLNDVVDKCTSFKIGKTSDVDERFNAPDYRDKYSHIKVLFSSKSKVLVGYMESVLIDECLLSVPNKCDNEKGGAESLNDQMPNSQEYYVYVVWR